MNIDYIKDKYGKITGKTDSMYVYVLYECPKSEIISHIQNQLKIIDRITDGFKRKLFSARYYLLRDMINNTVEQNGQNKTKIKNDDTNDNGDNNDKEYIFNNLIFISDTLASYELEESWYNLLKDYSHSHISYKYSDHYDIDFLIDLLENRTPYHIIKINNNCIEYIQITRTKKKLVQTYESKTLIIEDFIKEHITSKTISKYIIYGVSSKLKGFTDPKCYQIINKSLKDEEVIEMIDQMDQDDILDQFDKDLEMISDSRQMNKIIFKKEIKQKIELGQIEKLYISDKIYDKFIENLKKFNLDINFKLIKIDTNIKSFIESREKKINNYDGVVGVAYY